MEVNFWYLGILIVFLVIIIPVLVIRVGLERRKKDRRKHSEPIEKDLRKNERRQAD